MECNTLMVDHQKGYMLPMDLPECKSYLIMTCVPCGRTEKEGGGSLSRCAGCKKQEDCIRECQEKHWAGHKAACKAWKAFARSMASMDATGAA